MAFLFKLPPLVRSQQDKREQIETRVLTQILNEAPCRSSLQDVSFFYDTVVNGGWVDGQVAGVFCGAGVVNKRYVKPENTEYSYT